MAAQDERERVLELVGVMPDDAVAMLLSVADALSLQPAQTRIRQAVLAYDGGGWVCDVTYRRAPPRPPRYNANVRAQ